MRNLSYYMSAHNANGTPTGLPLRKNEAGMDFHAADDYDLSEPLIQTCSTDLVRVMVMYRLDWRLTERAERTVACHYHSRSTIC